MLQYEVGRRLWRLFNLTRPLEAGSAQSRLLRTISRWVLNISVSPMSDAPVLQSSPWSLAGLTPVSSSVLQVCSHQSLAEEKHHLLHPLASLFLMQPRMPLAFFVQTSKVVLPQTWCSSLYCQWVKENEYWKKLIWQLRCADGVCDKSEETAPL